jgi:hypothetical protein
MKKVAVFLVLLTYCAFAQASWVSTYNDIVQPIWDTYQWSNTSNIEQIPSSRDLRELEANYGNENMYYIYSELTDEQVLQNNENLNNILELALTQELAGPGVRQLSRGESSRVYRAVERERVVKNQHKYDPDEVLGLCFGRATIADIHARVRGVDPSAIKKIWVLGDMKKWQFHVATMLKEKKKWTVIDTYTGKLSLERWVRRMQRDKKRNARELMFFVTSAARFGFMSNHIYSASELFNYSFEELDNYVEDYKHSRDEDFYKGFFVDFFISLDKRIDRIRQFD